MGVMNTGIMTITICAACKRELKRGLCAGVEDAPVVLIGEEEVVYSHGICYDCGVRLYGAKIMAGVSTRLAVGDRS